MRRRLIAAAVIVSLAAAAVAVAAGGGVPAVKLKPLALPAESLAGPDAAVLSPNGKVLYVADVLEGALAINLAHPSADPAVITDGGEALDGAYGLAVSPNGKTLYISNDDGGSKGVDIADVSGSESDPSDGKVVGEIKDPHHIALEPGALALSRDGKTLYIANLTQTTPTDMTEILVAKLTNARTGAVVKIAVKPRTGYVAGLALTSNGRLLYAGDEVGPAEVFKVAGNSLNSAKTLTKASGLYGLAVSPDGRTLYGAVVSSALSGSGNGVSKFETFALTKSGADASLRRTETFASGSNVTGLALSAGGRTGYVDTVGYMSSGPSFAGGVSTFAIPPAATKATVTGHDRVGSTLKARVKAALGASLTFKWYANGKAIKGVHKSSLTITSKVAGKKISVKVSATAVGYSPATLAAKL